MIYCVEDDESSRELMVYALGSAGMEARGFADAASFREAMKKEKPELIFLDIMLPDRNGISLLKELKDNAGTQDIPVIMASAKGAEYDKVMGLDLGADDYLAKPFGMMEMVSRAKAVLRRAEKRSGEKSILKNGTIELDEKSHTVKLSGEEIALTLKEYELLRLFMKHPGRVFTREELLSYVWDTEFGGETRTVDVHVGTLRSKLQSEGSLIRTVRGVGYRMEMQK